jgi:hypothetical protein
MGGRKLDSRAKSKILEAMTVETCIEEVGWK